jgi:hypothetical protein
VNQKERQERLEELSLNSDEMDDIWKRKSLLKQVPESSSKVDFANQYSPINVYKKTVL